MLKGKNRSIDCGCRRCGSRRCWRWCGAPGDGYAPVTPPRQPAANYLSTVRGPRLSAPVRQHPSRRQPTSQNHVRGHPLSTARGSIQTQHAGIRKNTPIYAALTKITDFLKFSCSGGAEIFHTSCFSRLTSHICNQRKLVLLFMCLIKG